MSAQIAGLLRAEQERSVAARLRGAQQSRRGVFSRPAIEGFRVGERYLAGAGNRAIRPPL